MLVIEDSTIMLTRGNSAVITVDLTYEDGSEYIPEEGDRISFSLRRYASDDESILSINIPIDTLELEIDPSHTRSLESGPIKGQYRYDMELVTADGFNDTFIDNAEFILL